MRILRVVLGIVIATASLPAFAARITTVDGYEVTIQRGPPARPPHLAVNAPRRIGTNAIIKVSAGVDVDAANNDYRRIQNAINTAIAGDTIILFGWFDFTRPFAAAAWALGNDNTASTSDDYSVHVPAGLSNVVLTADFQGITTIRGPGDLPNVDLEAFLLFDGGDNQGWTISNLRIFDFDLAIGMFAGAGNTDAFNDTIIQNNLILIAQDLNATAAPADALQNVGIHYSFGTNQTMTLNTIQSRGEGVSAGAALSSEVAMQCNISGGAIYDGLSINNNTINVFHASASPQTIIGIWENAHAHTSNISVNNNSYSGSDDAFSMERAFRITSHSSATTTVQYANNYIYGANIGFEWMASEDFTGNRAVMLLNNTTARCVTGVLVQSNGIAHLRNASMIMNGTAVRVLTGTLAGAGAQTEGMSGCIIRDGGEPYAIRIEAAAGPIAPISRNYLNDNGYQLLNDSAYPIDAERNFWGHNYAANVAEEVSGDVDFDPWLASGSDVGFVPGFQAFLYATTSGTITTFAGTEANDVAGILMGGGSLTMHMNGEIAYPLQILNFDIQLGAGDDRLTLEATGIPTILDMGPGTEDTLSGPNDAVTYDITGTNSGTVAGVTNTFTGVEHIVAGIAADSFLFAAGGMLGGSIDGNLGADTLDVSAVPAAAVNVTGPGTLDGWMGTATPLSDGFDNIDRIVGVPANLSVAKSGPESVSAGSPITYAIAVANSGPNAAAGVTLTDVLGSTTFVSLALPAGWACSTPAVGAGGIVTCTRTTMAVGTESFTLVVNAPLATGSVVNTAVVTSANEGSPGNESSTTTTVLQGIADVAITKSGPATATQASTMTYTITVTNNGPLPATNVTVTDTLPAGVAFDSVTPSQGMCVGTSTITCTVGTLNNGASATITLNVIVTASSGAITNTATVTSPEDTTTGNNSASTTTNAAALVPIPSTSVIGLLLLVLALALVAFIRVGI